MVTRIIWTLLLVGMTAGCRDRVADSLLGRWVGQPDTAADRGAREAARYQDLSTDSRQGSLPEPMRQGTPPLVEVTDWERYKVRILLEFARAGELRMSLANGTEPRLGVWRVVQETPIGLVIEIVTRGPGMEEGQKVSAPGVASARRRRFELQLDYEDHSGNGQECVGFRLVELGADPRLGAIYFKREKSS